MRSPSPLHSSRSVASILTGLLLLILLPVPSAFGQLIVTNDNGDGSVGSLGRAYQETLAAGGTITFHPNLSGATISLVSTLFVGKDLVIDASNLADGITIDGANGERLFAVFPDVELTLRGLTLANANAGSSSDGSAVYNSGNLLAEECTFVGNSARNGGAIYNEGSLTLRRCTLSGNSATGSGGAIYHKIGTARFENCTVATNSANTGGGIRVDDQAELVNTTV